MLVCQCHNVTDRKLRALVQAGAKSAGDVARACKAGTSCGSCRPAVLAIVREELAAVADRERESGAGLVAPAT